MENKELLEVLGRIANALEKIEEHQEKISALAENLDGCIAYLPPRYHMKEGYKLLRIGGDVTTT